MNIGARYEKNAVEFRVWAPLKKSMTLHIVYPEERDYTMNKDEEDYFFIKIPSISKNMRYFFRPDNEKGFPDPASRYQPSGVFGHSEVIDHENFPWNDAVWHGVPKEKLILYELHVGTFSGAGTFAAIIPRLDDLSALGITAIQLMPIAQFPGHRNWGYDGVFPYAVQNSYGGPDGLKKLIDACHLKGIAVFLDVVYNHLGPEGNCLNEYGPYFTDRYKTPWGKAFNLDGEWSDGVRDFFIQNIIEWFEHYHIDGLRVDAIHMMFDNGSVNFWQQAYKEVKKLEQRLGRPLHLIAESDYNHPRVVQSPDLGGLGFSAQWLDDFHHALYVLLYEKGLKFYEDFGSIEQLAKAYVNGFVHSGDYVHARKKKFGASSAGVPGDNFVVFNQNHDQIGNKGLGERLATLLEPAKLKLAAAAIILSPYIPMLFMGEEYAEKNPFLYFIDHADEQLIEAVKKGRAEEFKAFMATVDSPDPQDEKTFEQSKLNWQLRNVTAHQAMFVWYKKLIKLRLSEPIFLDYNKNNVSASVNQKLLILKRQRDDGKDGIWCFFNFSGNEICELLPQDMGYWVEILNGTLRPFPPKAPITIEPWGIRIFKRSRDNC